MDKGGAKEEINLSRFCADVFNGWPLTETCKLNGGTLCCCKRHKTHKKYPVLLT